ncbi:hypothetical protein FQA39_LY05812 [Lamprigera yunnana]|nr:hypothetical protein FQA39_LY05812 [Lamprigera yunnana]
MSSPTMLEVQREITAHLEQDRTRREVLLSARGRRSCSEQGPHPGTHLWGPRRSRKRTSAPQMGSQQTGARTALILRSRRSWPVAPITHNSEYSEGVIMMNSIENVPKWGRQEVNHREVIITKSIEFCLHIWKGTKAVRN